MQPETLKLLADIQHAGSAILQYASAMTPQQYESDVLLRSLVKRQCEIIGEALRRLERADPLVFARIRHARRIIDFRNVIAHGYDSLDAIVVTQVVQQHLRSLLDDVAVVNKFTDQ